MSVQTQLTPTGNWWAIEVDINQRHRALTLPEQIQATQEDLEDMVRDLPREPGTTYLIIRPDESSYPFAVD